MHKVYALLRENGESLQRLEGVYNQEKRRANAVSIHENEQDEQLLDSMEESIHSKLQN